MKTVKEELRKKILGSFGNIKFYEILFTPLNKFDKADDK
jgi:hypothetical protein